MKVRIVEEGNDQERADAPNSEKGVNLSSRKSRGASGPRTAQGKKRSKYNAIKHGIFAKVVLPGESRPQYEFLLRVMLERFNPQDPFEEILVEKVVMLLWCQKRLIEAENAEFQDRTEFLEWEDENRKLPSPEELHVLHIGPTQLIDHKENPEILERCVTLLLGLKVRIIIRGFDRAFDTDVLAAIYGINRPIKTLLNSYSVWYETSLVSEEERQRRGYASPAVCKQRVLEDIDDEIARLLEYQKMQQSVTSKRANLARIRLRVPHSPDLDRFLRYMASLDRSLDRTLNQLERLQRMRLGQSVPPPLQVNLSS
jgi:hypothetical protein